MACPARSESAHSSVLVGYGAPASRGSGGSAARRVRAGQHTLGRDFLATRATERGPGTPRRAAGGVCQWCTGARRQCATARGGPAASHPARKAGDQSARAGRRRPSRGRSGAEPLGPTPQLARRPRGSLHSAAARGALHFRVRGARDHRRRLRRAPRPSGRDVPPRNLRSRKRRAGSGVLNRRVWRAPHRKGRAVRQRESQAQL